MSDLTPRLYIVHYHEDALYGYEWTDTPIWAEAKKYPVKFNLRGKLASFVIVSNDLAVTRLDAISFCAAIVAGRVKTFNCDFSSYNEPDDMSFTPDIRKFKPNKRKVYR